MLDLLNHDGAVFQKKRNVFSAVFGKSVEKINLILFCCFWKYGGKKSFYFDNN